ncbi:hypothetical protein ACHAWF_015154 [Thalassiosira exigua]
MNNNLPYEPHEWLRNFLEPRERFFIGVGYVDAVKAALDPARCISVAAAEDICIIAIVVKI